MNNATVVRPTFVGLCLSFLLVLSWPPTAPAATADEPFGGGDKITASIANRLDGRWSLPWEATVLFDDRYVGPRRGEIVQIPQRYKREVGIIRVPISEQRAARRALQGMWFVQRGPRFVVPLRNETWTVGCRFERPCERTAAWVARRLGGRWHVVAPLTVEQPKNETLAAFGQG